MLKPADWHWHYPWHYGLGSKLIDSPYFHFFTDAIAWPGGEGQIGEWLLVAFPHPFRSEMFRVEVVRIVEILYMNMNQRK
jgi:hypothetical protein